MSPFAAFLEGWRRVLQAPAALFGTWLAWWGSWQLVTTALSAPHAVAIVTQGSTSKGAWFDLLRAWVEHLSYGFAPELSQFFSPFRMPRPVLAAFAVQGMIWLFFSGGLLDRYARARPIRSAAFFAACGVFFFRFLRLALLIAALGYGLWRTTVTVRSNDLADTVVLALVAGLGVICDFAQARAVVEDRHSMIGALAAAVRFVRRRLLRVAVLTALNGVALSAPALAATWVLPSLQLSFALAENWRAPALLFVHLLTRLACLASEIAFFQGELAHAGYTAAPVLVWPDSPTVEGLENSSSKSSTR